MDDILKTTDMIMVPIVVRITKTALRLLPMIWPAPA
jgi:hypothetical protein